MVNPSVQTTIEGEASIARYLARQLNPSYDSVDIVTATQIDSWLDTATQLVTGSAKDKAGALRTMNAKLGQSTWLMGEQLSLADIVVWSAIQQTKQGDSAPANVKKWVDNCKNHAAFQTVIGLI